MEKVKYTREHLINASKSIIYNCLTTPSGLSEWFADDVNIRNDVFTFIWDGSEEQAKLLTKKKDEFVKFQWLEDEGTNYFFEIRIAIDAMTREVALLITDHAEEDEIEEGALLWESLVDNLKRILGS